MPTITRTQVRQEILRRLPSLGRVLTADSITKAGPALTQVSEYERQRAAPTSYEGQYIYRYNLSDPDRWRRITTVDTSTGIVSVDGPPYVDNSDLAYERLGIFPDTLNGFIAEAQRKQRVRTNIALVGYGTHDLDMETSGVQYWDGTLGGSVATATTVSKIASSVFSGTQALQCVTTNATNSVLGEQCQVIPGQLVYMAFIFQCTGLTGSLTFGIYGSGGLLTSSTISAPVGTGWVMVGLLATASTTNYVQPYFSASNTGQTYVVDTCFGPYRQSQTDFTLQSGINEMYKLRYVRPSHFMQPLTTAGFFDAESIVYDGDYTQPENFVVEAFYRDATPNKMRLVPSTYFPVPITGPAYGSSSWPPASTSTFRPVWLAMEAQVSDFEPLLTESSTTSQPLDLVVAYSIRLAAEYIVEKSPTDYWRGVLNEYKMYAAVEDNYRPPQPMAPQRRFHLTRA